MRKFYQLFFVFFVFAFSAGAQVKNMSDFVSQKRFDLKSAATSTKLKVLPPSEEDCGCKIDALILFSDNQDIGVVAYLKNNLMATGRFASVNSLSFYPNPGITVADIQDYDAVLVYMNIGNFDYSSVSQALRDYMDSGGGVITCVLTNHDDWNLNLGAGYEVVGTAGSYSSDNISLGNVSDPFHPVMYGVKTLSFYTYFHSSAQLNPATTMLADWNNGQPAVSVRENIGINNARAVDLNFFPNTVADNPNAVLLMANSLIWASKQCVCPCDVTVDNDPGVCGAVVNYSVPSPLDAVVTQVDDSGLTSGDLFPVGATVQEWKLDYGDGDVDTCSLTVTVVDTEDPVINCPEDIIADTDPGKCGAVVNYEIPEVIAFSDTFIQYQAYGNCNKWEEFCSQLLPEYDYTRLTMKGTYDPVGVTLTDPVKIKEIADALREGVFASVSDGGQTWSVYDAEGSGIELTGDGLYWDCNSRYAMRPCINHMDWGGIGTYSCEAPSQRMTVEFETAPSGLFAVRDNCDNFSVVQTAGLPIGSEFPIGTTTNSFEISDGSGNLTVCTFDVTVEDKEPPALVASPLDIVLRENGEYVLNKWDIAEMVEGTEDNCTPFEDLEITVFPRSFACVHVGEPVDVEVTATDTLGNSVSEWTTVTVHDTIPPVMSCQDIEVELDENGKARIYPAWINSGDRHTSVPEWARTYNDMESGCYDACGIETLELSRYDFTCDDIGPNTVTMTAWDPSGNSSVCEVTVTVVDGSMPWVECMDTSLVLDENGMAQLTPEMVVADYGDLCGIDTVIVDPMEFDCSMTGDNDVTVRVIDNGGNESACTATVTVIDDQVPVIEQAEDVEITVAPGICMTPVAEYPAIIADDNCDNEPVLEEGYGPDGSFPLGTSVETWTVTDGGGNTATMSFNVTVSTYNGAPEIDAVDDQVLVQDSGVVMIELTGITPGVDCEEQLVTEVVVSSSDTAVVKATVEYTEGSATASLYLEPGELGEGEITVSVYDNGGTENGGTDVTEITFMVDVVEEIPVHSDFELAGDLKVNLYPNPTRDMVNIDIDRSVSCPVDVAVYNISGKQIIRRIFSDSQYVSFSMKDNVSGLYFVKMNIEGTEIVKKLVLDRQ